LKRPLTPAVPLPERAGDGPRLAGLPRHPGSPPQIVGGRDIQLSFICF